MVKWKFKPGVPKVVDLSVSVKKSSMLNGRS
jgi:hypothetical protein